MTINSTTRKTNNLAGNGNTHTYPFSFKVFADTEIVVKKLEVSTSIETTLTLGLNNDYVVTLSQDQNGNPGGSITLKQGGNNFNLPSGFQLVITSAVQPLQGTDLTNQGGFYPEVINDALDKAIILHQQQQEKLDRSISFSLTNTIGSLEVTENAAARANKVFAFDNAGEFSVLSELGTYRGDWAASTSYAVRDLVKDTSTNNIFFCNTAHTSSGSQPLTTNTNSANWNLIVDAATATTSANTATTQATAAANSATASANSATAAATSETNAATSETNANTHKNDAQTAKTAAETAQTAAETAKTAAETALDSFDDRYLGAKNSDPTVDNDGNSLIDGALYFNTIDNVTKVYDLGNTVWRFLTPTDANQTKINAVQAALTNVNTVANDINNVNTVAADISNVNAVVSNATNINAVAQDLTDIGAVAGKATEIGRLGTADAVADLAILATTDVVADLALLGTSAVVEDMSLLGTTDVVADMALLATTDCIADMNTLAVSDIISDMNVLANSDIISDMNTIAASAVITDLDILATNTNVANMNTLVGIKDNIVKVANLHSEVTAVAGNQTNINNAATYLNNFLQLYLGEASSNPTSDGLGNNVTEGDLYFNSVDKRLRVFNGSVFQNLAEGAVEVAKFATSAFNALYTASAGSNSIDLGGLAITGAVFSNEAISTIRASLGKGSGTYNLGGI
mgnify:CR=1 FL=1|tara:strand:+ start:49 stop:2118 length:2070 start_codon:yes stop_codon:yes gene_type:complete